MQVHDLTYFPFAERELMLIKIAVNAAARRDVLDIASIFRAIAVDVSDHTITLQVKYIYHERDFCLRCNWISYDKLLEIFKLFDIIRVPYDFIYLNLFFGKLGFSILIFFFLNFVFFGIWCWNLLVVDTAYWGSRQDGCTTKVVGALWYMRGWFCNLPSSFSDSYNLYIYIEKLGVFIMLLHIKRC